MANPRSPKSRRHAKITKLNLSGVATMFSQQIKDLIPIPFLPVQVDPAALHTNLKLLSDDEITKAIKYAAKQGLRSGAEILSNELGLKYNLEIHGTDIFAVYANTATSDLGKGAFGTVKPAQKLTGAGAGTWFALKQQVVNADTENFVPNILREHAALIQLNQSPSVPSSPREVLRRSQELVNSPRSPRPINDDSRNRTPSPLRSDSARRAASAGLIRRSSSGKIELELDEYMYPLMMNLAKGINLGKLIDQEDDQLSQVAAVDLQAIIPLALRFKLALDTAAKVNKLVNVDKKLHRDLKLDNIMGDLIHASASLIDYGNVGELDKDGVCKENDLLGTAIYFAPELRKERIKVIDDPSYVPTFVFNELTEVYALGIVFAQFFRLYDYDSLHYEDPDHKVVDLRRMGDKSFIYENKDADEYYFNFALLPHLNPEQAERLLNLLHKMTAVKPEDRCSLVYVGRELHEIFSSYLALEETAGRQIKQKVAALDVQEYLSADADAKAKLLTKLSAQDEVWLLDTGIHTKASFVKVKNELERAGLNVGDVVAPGANATEALRKLQEYLTGRDIPSTCTIAHIERKLENQIINKP